MTDSIPEFTASDWFTITGVGKVAAVDTRQGGHVTVGDIVRIDGHLYQVRGIEQSRILTNPPKLSPYIGLQVHGIDPQA